MEREKRDGERKTGGSPGMTRDDGRGGGGGSAGVTSSLTYGSLGGRRPPRHLSGRKGAGKFSGFWV